MNLKLTKLELINFMGGTLSVEFTQDNDVFGMNKGGKSRLKDAYQWLITGKNSEGKAQFDIKDHLNPDRNKMEHTVIGHFIRDEGTELTLQKNYLEIWSPDKGSAETKLKGHTTNSFFNGHKKSESEYKELMEQLVPANILLMLSDPLHFPNLNWKDQRDVLDKMSKNVTNDYVIDFMESQKKDVTLLRDILGKGDKISERQKRLKFEISEAKKEKDTILPKIQENTLTISGYEKVNEKALNKEILGLQEKIEAIDLQITDKLSAEDQQSQKQRDQRNELNQLRSKLDEIKNTHTSAFNREKQQSVAGKAELNDQIESLKSQITSKENLLKSKKNIQISIDEQLAGLLDEFKKINELVQPPFDETDFKCHTCGRLHEENNIASRKKTQTEAFAERNEKKMDEFDLRGNNLQKEKSDNVNLIEITSRALDSLKLELSGIESQLEALNLKISQQSEIESIEDRIAKDVEYTAAGDRITDLNDLLSKVEQIDYADLKEKKKDLTIEVDALKAKLSTVQLVKTLTERNEVLAAREKALAQQIATSQKEDMLIDDFIISRMDEIEKSVRSKFQYVTFKMFDKNIGDGTVNPFCEAWFEGKPFSALNTASKLNAGLDILNGLSNHYGITVPIWMDNREGVSKIIDINAQSINLFVSPEDTTLRILNK